MPRAKFTSVDEYIAAQPRGAQPILRQVRSAIRKALPGAEESISYQIAAYKLHGERVIYFAGFKEHYSLYPATRALVAAMKGALGKRVVSKGTIRFTYDEPVPSGLIARIAKLRAKEATARARAKQAKGKSKAVRGLVALAALLMTACGSEAPTGPTHEARPQGKAAATSLSALAGMVVEIVRAPPSGQTFKVNKLGSKPQPAPKFRFEVTTSSDVVGGEFNVQFVTASGKACGIGSAAGPITFSANVPRMVDIPNGSIVVGPKACSVEGMSCTPSQCKFPLTTRSLKFRVGDKSDSEPREYKWTSASTGGGGGGGGNGLTCNGEPVPDTISCGVPTVRCGDGTYRCSVSPLTCGGGFIFCYVCPGPLCP